MSTYVCTLSIFECFCFVVKGNVQVVIMIVSCRFMRCLELLIRKGFSEDLTIKGRESKHPCAYVRLFQFVFNEMLEQKMFSEGSCMHLRRGALQGVHSAARSYHLLPVFG